jgi:hypothetical protein
MPEAKIQSAGPPPERHADRVVAEVLRVTAVSHASTKQAISDAIINSSDGSPKAQRKMEARIKAAGASNNTYLTPGKRGRYALQIYDLSGWDPARDIEIGLNDPIPREPWIVCWLNLLESEGRGRIDLKSAPILFVTHHALSRAAQRWGARTVNDLISVVHVVWNGALRHINSHDDLSWLELPPQGIRIQVGTEQTLTVVLKRHDKWNALIAATVF